MIQDGVLVFNAGPDKHTFSSWEFDSEVLNFITIGLLTTILSYQLTGTCYNIAFGLKERGRSTACEIHKLILTESSSSLEVLSALVRVDILDRLRFRNKLPTDMKIMRRDTSVSKRTAFTLFILFLIAPISSVITIFISREYDTISSSGIVLGVGHSNVNFQEFLPFCDRVPSRVVGLGRIVGRFLLCFSFETELGKFRPSEQVRLIAETTAQGQIKVSVLNLPSNIPFSTSLNLDLSTEGKLLRVMPLLSPSDAARLIHDGQDKLATLCKNATLKSKPQHDILIKIGSNGTGLVKASKDFRCTLKSYQEFFQVLFNMTERVNLLEKEVIYVVNLESISSARNASIQYYEAGEQEPVLITRNQALKILPLLLIVFLSVVLRITTAWCFNNDIEEGIEAVMRNTLLIAPGESMLRSSRSIVYNSKWEHGLSTHFGLPGPSL